MTIVVVYKSSIASDYWSYNHRFDFAKISAILYVISSSHLSFHTVLKTKKEKKKRNVNISINLFSYSHKLLVYCFFLRISLYFIYFLFLLIFSVIINIILYYVIKPSFFSFFHLFFLQISHQEFLKMFLSFNKQFLKDMLHGSLLPHSCLSVFT